MGRFAVIDTETNWENRVMSIGTVIADADTFQVIAAQYHILTPEYRVGGMFDHALVPDRRLRPVTCSRKQAMNDLIYLLAEFGVSSIFAYNAAFDYKMLPELNRFQWYDIMRLAAYRQYNHQIPEGAEFCRTGRLKRGYGVEPMLRMLSGDHGYCESHNALYDALDELEIMRLLGHGLDAYIPLC